MITPGFTTTILVDQTPNEAFNAIKDIRGWWFENINVMIFALRAGATISIIVCKA